MKHNYLLFVNYRRLLHESICAFSSAHELGYKVLLIASDLPEALSPYVDKFERCKTNDLQQLLFVCDKVKNQYDIIGVPALTETAIEASSIIAARFGLVGLSIDSVSSVRNKDVMRKLTRSIDCLPSMVIDANDDVYRFIKEYGYPCIIKPINASGSTGIYYVNKKSDIDLFFSSNQSILNPTYDPTLSHNHLTFVIEKYLQGQEFSVEGFVSNREIYIAGITHKTTSEPFKLEVRHIFPAKLFSKDQDIILTKTKQYIMSLGINNGAFHLEGKFDGTDFMLIEVAGRPGGDYIASSLIYYAKEYNLYKNLLKIYANIVPDAIPDGFYKVAGVHYIMAQQEGILTGYHGIYEVLSHPWVKQVIVENAIGADIKLPPTDYRKQRLICIISTAPTHLALNQHFDWVQNTLIPIFNG